MEKEQIYQEINLNISNQINGNAEEKLSQVIDFLYGGAFDEMLNELLEKK